MINKCRTANKINTVEYPVIGVNLIRETSKGVFVAFNLVPYKFIANYQHIYSGTTALDTEFLQDLRVAIKSSIKKSNQGRTDLLLFNRNRTISCQNIVHICIMLFMPRKAKPQQVGVKEAIQRIDAYRQLSSLSVLSLSRLCAVNQPSLARFLKGDRKTITSTARIVLDFIDENNKQHKQHNRHSHATIPDEIEAAILYLWDGKTHSADLVASLIRALKPILEISAVHVGKRIGGGAL